MIKHPVLDFKRKILYQELYDTIPHYELDGFGNFSIVYPEEIEKLKKDFINLQNKIIEECYENTEQTEQSKSEYNEDDW